MEAALRVPAADPAPPAQAEPVPAARAAAPPGARPHVVIVGAGFGGLSAARALCGRGADVTVVDRQNYHLFQPLLYQVATAGLSPADIAAPIRRIISRHKATRVIMGEVSGIDTHARRVELKDGGSLTYDHLILATGARHSYFGRDDWEEHAPGLKTIDDALAIRRRVLIALERAETEPDMAARRRLLTFVVIGGGPTGVEMAGAIAELARGASMDFRRAMLEDARVVLIEAGPRVLATFPAKLSECASQSLTNLGVEVRTGKRVTGIDADGVTTEAEHVPSACVVWAAGVRASPAGAWLRTECDRSGRVAVGPDLSVPGHPDIFVIGDTAAMLCDGAPVPGIAPAAKQGGEYVAKVIAARIAGRPAPAPFRYAHAGNLATVGRSRAVIDFGRIKLSGFPAWVLWSTAHIYFLVGFRSRLLVGANWLWNYLTFDRSARLITGTGFGA